MPRLRLRRPPLRVCVWSAAALALLLVAALLWRASDVAATDSTTAPTAHVPDSPPDADLAQAWSTTGDPLPDAPVESGRVMVGGEHGITALDAVTGEQAWHYTRGNAVLCDVTAVDGVAIGLFRTGDRCDEAVALDADTGLYRWTRNVNFAADVELSSTDGLLMAEDEGSVVLHDPRGNGKRWRYRAPGDCRLLDAAVGDTGVAVLQRCAAGTVQLRLFDGFNGKEHWTRDVATSPDAVPRLAGADRLVAVVVDDRLEVHRAEDGDVLETFDLPASDGDPAGETLHQAAAGSLALVWARDTVWALDGSTGRARWSRPALGLPTADDTAKVSPGASSVLVPENDGFVRRDLATGDEVDRLAVDGGLAEPGLTQVVGPVVVYRLPDRVLGYR